ncbi:Endonuclease, Uma2 family (restriction endonuclease fold) [Amycolatopsis pretoriensis]|uniref:Endonuclease, Uma2 family (Restriction endonuclease fold) n=1 Tax=Amycolatopsis pretoriensis TaxID=218821 RepID=A0A1H5QWN6_9PSEU|nr:Uma2 family endonuclease [Amycolatopsis pretoriensis]SEF30469.1 Endonuclease, Uma2 family (restriction endonuclease fold) [Amycolatopsis pretoriensis]
MVTLDEWAALPEETDRLVEVVAGEPIPGPRRAALHQLAVNRLTNWLDDRPPTECSALQQVELIVARVPLTIRVPDVLVAPSSLVQTNPPRLDAGDVRLVVEVLSDGTRRTDQVMKFSEYAEAGIEHYWIVDLDSPISMITYRLIDNDYENFGEFSGVAELQFAGTSLTIDLNALAARRP